MVKGLGHSMEECSTTIGPPKPTLVADAFEVVRCRSRSEGIRIPFGSGVLRFIRDMDNRKQEHPFCVSLNGATEIMAVRSVFVWRVYKSEIYTCGVLHRHHH